MQRLFQLIRHHRLGQLFRRLQTVARNRLRHKLPRAWVFSPTSKPFRLRPNAEVPLQRIASYRLRARGIDSGHQGGPKTSDLADGTFRFLNHSLRLVGSSEKNERDRADRFKKMCWQPEATRLWRFHLQCHEYLLALSQTDTNAVNGILRSWISDERHKHPILDGDAWHPFCISRRLPIWLCLGASVEIDEDIREQFWQSLSDQVLWLQRNLELDLGGNHLLENLCALTLANSFLTPCDAAKQEHMDGLLQRELAQQILPSGEHFERTPTYHALMLQCLLQMSEALAFRGDSSRELLGRVVLDAGRMSDWLVSILHCDQSIPLWGDSAIGETPCPQVLADWTGVFQESSGTSGSAVSADSSDEHWTSEPSNGYKLCMDTGDVGCDHLPAHAHCDLLQITASVGGVPMIVDTGNYDYEDSDMRALCRSTKAHNVLQIDRFEQCDVWSRFRMGRRGHVIARTNGQTKDLRWCMAQHDAFRSIGVPETGRLVVESPESWTVIDWFRQLPSQRKSDRLCQSRIHLHPDFNDSVAWDASQACITVGSTVDAVTIQALEASASVPDSRWEIGTSWYCPDFGVRHKNPVLCLTANTAKDVCMGWRLSWSGNLTKEWAIRTVHLQEDSICLEMLDASRLRISSETFLAANR